jgi:hypothetical protein
MSAYVVTTDTIDYLVAAAARYQDRFHSPLPLDTDAETLAAAPVDYSGNTFPLYAVTNQNLVGAILLAQNVRSVNYRYSDNEPLPEYRYRPVSYDKIDPVLVLKSVSCLRYQSCETDDYAQTFAATVLDSIEKSAIHALRGYEDAPWGWTRDWDAERTAQIRAKIQAVPMTGRVQ